MNMLHGPILKLPINLPQTYLCPFQARKVFCPWLQHCMLYHFFLFFNGIYFSSCFRVFNLIVGFVCIYVYRILSLIYNTVNLFVCAEFPTSVYFLLHIEVCTLCILKSYRGMGRSLTGYATEKVTFLIILEVLLTTWGSDYFVPFWQY